MSDNYDAKDLKTYAESNRRLSFVAEEQGNHMLAMQLAVLARQAESRAAALHAGR